MEAVIFVGIQAVGKTSFFKERFFATHIRLSLDMLRTRHREQILVRACLEAKQPFVIDNTNPTSADRARYISLAKSHRFRVIGYFFQSSLDEALTRNAARTGRECVPEIGLRAALKRLQAPSLSEGFDALYTVRLSDGVFIVEASSDTS